MIKIPEKFLTSFKTNFTGMGKPKYVEVFVNPSNKEIREIDSYPAIRFLIDFQGNFYAFSSEIFHDTAISEANLSINEAVRGSVNFSIDEIFTYVKSKTKEEILQSLLNSNWVVSNLKGLSVYDNTSFKKIGKIQ